MTYKKTYIMNLLLAVAWLFLSLTFCMLNIKSVTFLIALICILLILTPSLTAHVLKVHSSPKLELIGLVLNFILAISFVLLCIYAFTGNQSMNKKVLEAISPIIFLVIGLPSVLNIRMLKRLRA